MRLALRSARALALPLVAATIATASAGTIMIRVRPGDTLWGLARAHHTTVDTLRRLNHIPASSDLILAGQLLRLPGTGAAHPATASTSSSSSSSSSTRVLPTVTYVVRPGDTVTAIAARYHVSPSSIMVRNHIPSSGLIVPGQRLSFPAAVPVHTDYPNATLQAAARDRALLAERSAPTQTEARAMVEQTAHTYNVDPTLALAIATMESGFQQRVVSDADAIGIMQVLPSTAAFIGDDVLHRHLDPLNAADNVTAGVVLLQLLTRAAPLPQAIAGYYQGLASVREHGMYADTQHYVATVLAIRARLQG